jgi:hypothetical protein
MKIDLTFADLVKLALHGKLEKDGATITVGRPVLTELSPNPLHKSGKVVFFLDETDERSAAAFDACN